RLDRIRDIAPTKAYHRISVDHELVHLKYRAVDPVKGALSNLFDIGRKTSRRHANAIEEQLLETIKEGEIFLLTHLHDNAVRIGRILDPRFLLACVFLRPTDVAVAKRFQPRRADRGQLT